MQGLQNVYVRIDTGNYYTKADFPVQESRPDHKTLSGKPSFMLEPVLRLFQHEKDQFVEVFEFPVFRERQSSKISVGKQELETYFQILPQYKALQNSDIEELIDEYEWNGAKPDRLASIAHRLARTAKDSQLRCVLELMARELDKI